MIVILASLFCAMCTKSLADVLPMSSTQSDFLNTGAVTSFVLPAASSEHKEAAPQRLNDGFTMAFINVSYADGEGIQFESQEMAKYGEGKILDVGGILVHVTSESDYKDHTACEPTIRGTNGDALPIEPWIALIQRGNCVFEKKVEHAFKHHAVGVIVYNDKDAKNLDKMKISNQDRNITAVFTFKWKGEQLIKLLNDHGTVYTFISEGSKYSKNQQVNRTSVLFVTISFIVLMIISLLWLIFYYVQRFRYLQTKDRQSKRLCNAAKRIIAKIPLKTVKADDKEIENDCCAICIESYKVNDLIRALPCSHDFHKNCVDPWLLEHRTCPMCKNDIFKHYGYVFTGSQESILQLDLDMEEADLYVNHGPRRNSVSPLPQIRPSEPRISIDSDSDNEVSSPNEQTPISQQKMPGTTNSNLSKHDVCVGCITAAFANKKHELESAEDDISEYRFGHSSLPSTLRKHRGSCSSSSHFHTHHHFTEHEKCNKKGRRAPLANLTQSISMHCDNLLKNAAEFSSIKNEFKEFIESKEKSSKEEEAKSCNADQSSKNNF